MIQKTSKNGKKIIKDFEGFRAIAYVCPAGVVTVGYGTTRINGVPVKLGTKITTDEADILLDDDLKVFEEAVNNLVTVELTQNQFDALVCFVYNIGVSNFKKSTLLKLLNSGEYQKASKEFIKWDKANGQTLSGLTRRRKAEQALFLKD